MYLTAQQFNAIVSPLQTRRGHDLANKRRAERTVIRCRSFITPVGTDNQRETPVQVMVEDFSPRGVCLVGGKELRQGGNFIMRLTRDGNISIALLCTVIYCDVVSESVWRVGAEFTCVVPEEETAPQQQTLDSDAERIRQRMLD